MPIPTRSPSVRAASKATPQSSDSAPPSSTAHAGGNVENSQHLIPSTAPAQHQATVPPASHTRSSSAVTSGLPRPRHTSVAQNIGDSRLQYRSGGPGQGRAPSAFTPSNHNRSQSTSTLSKNGLVAGNVPSSRASEKGTLRRPAFNTYQQHFSPQKPQPVAQSQVKLDDQESGPGSSREAQYTARLQDELLQLSLVHQHSSKSLKEFARSVEQKLELASRKLCEEREVVSALEAKRQRHINALVLLDWLNAEAETPSERKIQDLSFCVNELADMCAEGQTIDQVMAEFDQWQRQTYKTIQLQSNDQLNWNDSADMCAIARPGPTWMHKADECSKRLELCQRTLEGLGEAEPESGIGTMLVKNRQLTCVLLQKLRTAQTTVDAVMAHQERWLSSSVGAALDEVSGVGSNAVRRAIWSSFEPD